MNPQAPKRTKRKRRYVPHEAAARFKPTEDWTKEKAQDLFTQASFPFPVDLIHYEDCINGMRALQDESIDVIVADPPFGISFSGKEAVYNRDESLVADGYHEIEEKYEEFLSIKFPEKLNFDPNKPKVVEESNKKLLKWKEAKEKALLAAKNDYLAIVEIRGGGEHCAH